MKESELDLVNSVVDAFNENPQKLSQWEKGFMTDMAQRVEKYGADTFISAKQWGVIMKAAEKLGVPV